MLARSSIIGAHDLVIIAASPREIDHNLYPAEAIDQIMRAHSDLRHVIREHNARLIRREVAKNGLPALLLELFGAPRADRVPAVLHQSIDPAFVATSYKVLTIGLLRTVGVILVGTQQLHRLRIISPMKDLNDEYQREGVGKEIPNQGDEGIWVLRTAQYPCGRKKIPVSDQSS